MPTFSIGGDSPEKKKKKKGKKSGAKAAPVEEPKPKKKGKKSKKKGGKVLRDRAERSVAEAPTVYLPSPKWAEKRIEEEGLGFWTPQVGKNLLAMLPSLEKGRVSPWVETRGHYVGGNDVLKLLGLQERPSDLPLVVACLKFHTGDRCEICDLMGRLKGSKRKAERKLGSSLFAALQCYSNIVTKKNPDRVQVYRFGWSVAQPFLSALEDGNIFCDPRRMKMLKVRKEGSGMATKYTASVTNVKVDWREDWLVKAENLSKFVHPILSREEMHEVVDTLMANAQAGAKTGMDYEQPDGDDDTPF